MRRTPADSRDGKEVSSAARRPPVRVKGAAIWPDQWTNLDDLSWRLHDARATREERITANTVIRVAIDGLLVHAEQVHGDDETGLRAAWAAFVGLPLLVQSEPRTTPRIKAAAIYHTQWTGLGSLARRLQDARSERGERISPNTLIRVAIDGILGGKRHLQGNTEDQLRATWLEHLAGRAST